MAKKAEPAFAVGVNYGTNSVRALVVDTADGREIATAVYDYPSGEAGILLDPRDPHTARQNPADYIQGFFRSVGRAIEEAAKDPSFRPERVVGIGVDTTGSTPLPVDRRGDPLALFPEFADNLAAQAWLWKDHSSHAEAAEITAKAKKAREKYLRKCGGVYSSEWYWSKILHCKRTAPKVFAAAYSWVELADFVPAFATGNLNPDTLPRGICAAGHKAMYSESWGGLPSAKFLTGLDPGLAALRDRYAPRALTADKKAGSLTAEVAARVGLPRPASRPSEHGARPVAVAVGAFDAHMGAVGAGIKPGTLVKIIGTSTCDMMVAPIKSKLPDIPGLCGIVPGSVLPDMYGLEAGQSAVGDIFNWFVKSLVPASYASGGDAHAELTRAAAQAPTRRERPDSVGLEQRQSHYPGRSAADRPADRPDAAHHRGGNLPRVNRGHGLRRAVDHQPLRGVRREGEGGRQLRRDRREEPAGDANLCRRLQPADEDQSLGPDLRLGAAIFGAVAGGAYRSVEAAQKKMTGVRDVVYRPAKKAAATYSELYGVYDRLYNAFSAAGGKLPLSNVMKDLIAIRDRVRREAD